MVAIGIPVDELISAYREGRFPMCHPDGSLYWHDPSKRAIFPLDEIGPGRKLRQAMRSGKFTTTIDRAFEEVIRGCADRQETWIDERIITSFVELHKAGYAHSVEVWQEGELVGGVYGVAIGSVFFAESMFNRVSNAAKVAFYALVDLLRVKEFTILDSQYINAFTAQLGAVAISRKAFRSALKAGVDAQDRFLSLE